MRTNFPKIKGAVSFAAGVADCCGRQTFNFQNRAFHKRRFFYCPLPAVLQKFRHYPTNLSKFQCHTLNLFQILFLSKIFETFDNVKDKT